MRILAFNHKSFFEDKMIIHNYARNGAPFYKFQGEIAYKIMQYYDIIVIYSGHNELWAQAFEKSLNIGKAIKK